MLTFITICGGVGGGDVAISQLFNSNYGRPGGEQRGREGGWGGEWGLLDWLSGSTMSSKEGKHIYGRLLKTPHCASTFVSRGDGGLLMA